MEFKNDFYAGWFYGTFFDPFINTIRNSIYSLVPDGSRVIDIACGTGDQLIALAPKISHGTGIDLADRMIGYAERKAAKNKYDNLNFINCDALSLRTIQDKSYDIAIATLFFHEIDKELRVPIVREMLRIGNAVIIADYASPRLLQGMLMYFLESTIGIFHATHFYSYIRNGCMPRVFEELDLNYQQVSTAMLGMAGIWECRNRSPSAEGNTPLELPSS